MVMVGVDSYEGLWAEHAPAARRLALTLVTPDVADDIVSEAFARVLAASERGCRPVAFRPYLLAAVRNQARRWRAGNRRLVLAGTIEPSPSASAEAAVLNAEQAALVREAYLSLPQRWRAVLWQTEVEGKAPRVIACSARMTPNAVSALARRAREGLKQAYIQAHVRRVPPECEDPAREMGAYLRGSPGKRSREAVGAHLAGCPSCARLHAELASLNSRLPSVLGPGVLAASLSPAVRRAAWSWLNAGAAAVASVSAVAASGAVVVLSVPPGQAAPQRPAHAAVRAVSMHSPRAPYAGRHRRPEAPVSAPGRNPETSPPPPPVSSAPPEQPSPVASVTQAVSGTTSSAGQVVQSAGSTVSGVITGVTGTASGVVSQAGAEAGSLVSGLTTAVGSTLAGVGGLLGG